MTSSSRPALLPAGLRDLLPPDSMAEWRLVQQITKTVIAHGYDLVKPPLVEFEETLLAGSGSSLARQTFRLMDPLSQQMMAIRRDMTMQVARIAGSRLANSPRPLRLAYCGEVLRVSGTQLFPQRQFCQAGCELIGVDTADADAELILLAADCLSAAGIEGVSIDLNLPTFIPHLLAAHGFTGGPADALLRAIEQRDLTAVAKLGPTILKLIEALIAASGPVDRALEKLSQVEVPPDLQTQLDRLQKTVELLRAHAPGIVLTIDLIERRGFKYHTAISFAFFVADIGEVGRGGRYATGQGEAAIGFTFLVDTLLAAAPAQADATRVYLPVATPAPVAHDLQAKGFVTIRALDETTNIKAEAKRLGCTHYWDGALSKLGG